MSDLTELYRRTPRLESPEALDNAVLAHARLHAPEPARSRWHIWAPALSMACVGILGLSVVLRNGAPPLTGTDSMAPAAEVADSPSITPSVVSLEDTVSREESVTADTVSSPLVVADEKVALIQENAATRRATTEKAVAETASAEGATAQKATAPVPSDDTLAGVVQQKRKLSTTVDAARPQARTTLSFQAGESRVASDQMMSADSDMASNTSIQLSPEPTGHDWLLSQSDEHFTLKVAMSSNRSALEKLANELSAASVLFDPVFLHSEVHGWVLLSGSFNTRDTAVELRNQLDVAAGAEVVSIKNIKSELF